MERAAALRAERMRVQTEQLETADRIAELQAELADLARIAAPREERARVEAALRDANALADKLEARERALTSRLERAQQAEPRIEGDKDRLDMIFRVLEICTRARRAMHPVAEAYGGLCDYPSLVEHNRRRPGMAVELPDPEQLRRELFAALAAARKEVRAVVDAFADIALLYPASKSMLSEDLLENLASAPTEDVIENTPLARRARRIYHQLGMVCSALRDERQFLEDD